jgi:hypothetical protein
MRATLKKHMRRRTDVDLDTCELWVDVSVGIENNEIPIALQRFLQDVTQVYDAVIYLASGGRRVGVLGKLHRGNAANKTPLIANVMQTRSRSASLKMRNMALFKQFTIGKWGGCAMVVWASVDGYTGRNGNRETGLEITLWVRLNLNLVW